MAFSLSSWSVGPSAPCPSFLPRLPAVLLPHVCSYLSTKELLRGTAQTAKTTRDVLTPACFSSHVLALGSRELSLLSSLPCSSASLPLSPFYHSLVLTHCDLYVNVSSKHSHVQQLIDSLHHFPTCRALNIHGGGAAHQQLTDAQLHALLQHPTVLSCNNFTLDGFSRLQAEMVRPGEQQSALSVQARRRKRKRPSDSAAVSRQKDLDWADIRLPNVTRLRLLLHGSPVYSGGAAFLRAHTALLGLYVTTTLVSVNAMTSIFQDADALPHLVCFTLQSEWRSTSPVYSLTALVTALATTVMKATGTSRPMARLGLDIASTNGVFAAAALMPKLTRLQIQKPTPGWLQTWTGTHDTLTAHPHLEECYVYTYGQLHNNEPASAEDVQRFFQSMASRPMKVLSITTGQSITFTAAAMAELARCQQLQKLDIAVGIEDESAWMDWRDAPLFAPFSAGCLSCLRSLRLFTVKLSADAVTAIVAAAPQLRMFTLSSAQLSCHPAVVCAIVGGYCEHIEEVRVDDTCRYAWSKVQAADISAAYQSAVTAAGGGVEYKPFTQLRCVFTTMCWCTPPSIWHALLSLMKWATRLRRVAYLTNNDPLAVCALGYLPSLTMLDAACLWPLAFATLLERRHAQTGNYCYLAPCELQGGPHLSCPAEGPALTLTDAADEADDGRSLLLLLPHSSLFTAFQHSLAVEQQAVLTRWASGVYRAGDEQLTAAEEPPVVLEGHDPATAAVDHRHCPHPSVFHTRHRQISEERR